MNANVIIGRPLVEKDQLYANEDIDLQTEERFLPKILVTLGIFKSTTEVRKNRKDLFIELNKLDFLHFKIGKNHLWITVGE